MTYQVLPLVLIDRYYPPRTANPSGIKLPIVTGGCYELKPEYIMMLLKFFGLKSEDAYMFITEFEEVCAMMKIKDLIDDAVKLCLIPFALRGNARKWLYSLTTNSISTWVEFFIFLKKFFPMHKTARIRNEINQFHQLPDESF